MKLRTPKVTLLPPHSSSTIRFAEAVTSHAKQCRNHELTMPRTLNGAFLFKLPESIKRYIEQHTMPRQWKGGVDDNYDDKITFIQDRPLRMPRNVYGRYRFKLSLVAEAPRASQRTGASSQRMKVEASKAIMRRCMESRHY